MNMHPGPDATISALPKLCGADIELGNFIAGMELSGGTSYEASRSLLPRIYGFPCQQSFHYGSGRALWTTLSMATKGNSHSGNGNGASSYKYDPQEVSRRFLSENGGCAYIDLDHVELCLPEVRCAFDHVAAWHGMLRIARTALREANENRSADQPIRVLVNNSDGRGNTYGSHLNFLIRRRTFDNLFSRKAHYLGYLASFQSSAVILTGSGKVGSENGRPAAPYQISQRADFFATLQGVQTTYDRPIVNSRDEALCGRQRSDDASAPARLHVIFYDSALAHGSALFRVGPMQLILTLIELGLVNPRLILDDPLDAVLRYSHDATLTAQAALISGERFTALDLQKAYLEEVKRYATQGVFEGIVPRAADVIGLWQDTLEKLTRRDWMAVAPRLDWVMKLMAIERAMDQRPELSWESTDVKVIDFLYSDLDSEGLYWAYEANGFAEQLVPEERIAHFTQEPPEDTRAWMRAQLLRRAGPETVVSVDWDAITFRLRGRHNWPYYRTVDMSDPLGGTRADVQSVFDENPVLDDLLDALDSRLANEPQRENASLAN